MLRSVLSLVILCQPPQAVRIEAPQSGRPGITQYGSGVVVAEGVVATNEHVVRGAKSVQVHHGGSRLPAIISETDPKWDVAILACPQLDIRPIRISDQNLPAGEVVLVGGFGPGRWASGRGRLLMTANPPGESERHWFVLQDYSARNGDSGGPAITPKGELVGLVFGATHETHCVSVVPIRRALSRFLSGRK